MSTWLLSMHISGEPCSDQCPCLHMEYNPDHYRLVITNFSSICWSRQQPVLEAINLGLEHVSQQVFLACTLDTGSASIVSMMHIILQSTQPGSGCDMLQSSEACFAIGYPCCVLGKTQTILVVDTSSQAHLGILIECFVQLYAW